MWRSRCLSVIVMAVVLFQLIHGQIEVCMFYNLNADCYYRVDSVCLSHITAEVNQCTDPVEVRFTITCKRPRVDFDFTFAHSEQSVSVPGFMNNVELHVKLNMKEKDVLNVEADFYVNGKSKTDFINSDVKLAGMIDKCPLLNKAAQIAIGVMGGLVFIAAVLILVLLYVRHRRKQKLAQSSNHLVADAEDPGLSTPRVSTIRHENLEDEQTTDRSPGHQQHNNGVSSVLAAESQYSADSETNAYQSGLENGDLAAGLQSPSQYSIGADSETNTYQSGLDHSGLVAGQQSPSGYPTGADSETNTYKSRLDHSGRAAGLQSPTGMRYSDMVRSNHNQLKISDC